jgi:hypothetical protein
MVGGFAGWHALILVMTVIPFILWIVSLVQIGGSRAPGTTIWFWVVIVTFLPLVGAILWFAVGRRARS